MSRVSCWFLLVVISIAVAQADEHGLAKDGKSAFVIVTPAKPIPEEVTAANWLSTALKQVTGVHTFGEFISSKEFAASHPEYFGMDATGKRLTDDVRMFHKSGVELMTIEAEDLFGAGIKPDSMSADMQRFMPLRTCEVDGYCGVHGFFRHNAFI